MIQNGLTVPCSKWNINGNKLNKIDFYEYMCVVGRGQRTYAPIQS